MFWFVFFFSPHITTINRIKHTQIKSEADSYIFFFLSPSSCACISCRCVCLFVTESAVAFLPIEEVSLELRQDGFLPGPGALLLDGDAAPILSDLRHQVGTLRAGRDRHPD